MSDDIGTATPDSAAVAESTEVAGGYTVSTPTEPETVGSVSLKAHQGLRERFVTWYKGQSNLAPGIAVFVLVLVLIVLAGILVAALVPNQPTTNNEPVENTPATVSNEVLGYDYALAYLPHENGVIIDGGFPAGSTPEQKKEIVAKASAHDPFVLWYFLTRIYDMKEVPNMKDLEDMELRITWHQKLLTLLEASSFTNVSLDGKTFFNEGVNGNREVTASSTSFGEGVPGTEIGFAGETKTVKDNCVNRQMPSFPTGAIKGPDTTEGAARQPLRDENAVTTPTPGYDGGGEGRTGTAEDIFAEQEATAGSTENNGQVGHTGPATGGTNSSGETNLGGGESEDSLPGGVETPATGDVGAPG